MPYYPASAAAAVSHGKWGTDFILPGVAPVSITTGVVTVNQLRYYPIIVSTTITVDRLAAEVTSAGAAATTFRMGIYNADVDWQPTSLVVDGGTSAADSTGVKTVTINQTLSPGRYLLALHSDGAPILRVIRGAIASMGFASGLGASPFINLMRVTATYAVFASTGVAWTAFNSNVQTDYAVFMRLSAAS
jgi:hypothetical protein